MIRHAHQTRGFAVPLRPRHAEIMFQAGIGVGTFFMADHANALAAKTAEAADNGGILAVLAVAGERHEIGNQARDVIEAMRPLRVPRDLSLLPRRQAAIE